MKSIAIKLERIYELVETNDLNDWERKFCRSVYLQYLDQGKQTVNLSGKQVEVIDRIFTKYFAD